MAGGLGDWNGFRSGEFMKNDGRERRFLLAEFREEGGSADGDCHAYSSFRETHEGQTTRTEGRRHNDDAAFAYGGAGGLHACFV
jgi:hypothetical protein